MALLLRGYKLREKYKIIVILWNKAFNHQPNPNKLPTSNLSKNVAQFSFGSNKIDSETMIPAFPFKVESTSSKTMSPSTKDAAASKSSFGFQSFNLVAMNADDMHGTIHGDLQGDKMDHHLTFDQNRPAVCTLLSSSSKYILYFRSFPFWPRKNVIHLPVAMLTKYNDTNSTYFNFNHFCSLWNT